jgi:hypothetical protein
MLVSRLASAPHGIIAWPQNADGDAARLDVQTAILVRRSMEPTGHTAAGNIGQPIPTLGVQATTTLSTDSTALNRLAVEDVVPTN